MRLRKKALELAILIVIPLISVTTMINVVKASPIKMSVDPPAILNTALGPGTRFFINIAVDYIWELWGYQFELTFNPEILHGVSVEVGPFLGSAGGEVEALPGSGFDNEAGTLGLTGAALASLRNLPTGGSTEFGPLAKVTFEVVGLGRSNITLGLNSGMMNSTGGWQFDGEWAWGYKWIEWLPGYPLKVPNPEFLRHGYFDNRPAISVEPGQVKGIPINESFMINVNVINITDLYSWEFSMNWNATLLNATAVTEGGFLKAQPEGTRFGPPNISNEAGNLTVSCETIGAHPGVSGSGTLANVTFSVKDTGNSTLHLYATKLFDSTGNPIANRTTDGYFTNLKFHDIAIAGIALYPTRVKEGSGDTIFINVTVTNVGDFSETEVNVTTYYEKNKIDAMSIPSLDVGASETLTFMWNTTGVSRGKYSIWATASTETVERKYTYGLVTIYIHDIAITSVTTPVTNVFSGSKAKISVVVRNEGTELERFNVTAYYNQTAIDTQTVSDFSYGETTTLEFIWNTTGVKLGVYIISAKATVVEDEGDTADNIFVMEKLINVIPLEAQAFPTELFILAVIAVVIVAVTTFFYWRRRKRPEGLERS